MTEDVELIELIDVDPRAFGDTGGTSRIAPSRGRAPRPPRRRDPVRTATSAGVLVCGLAAVALGLALMVIRPWVPDLRLSLDDPRAVDSELTEQLIIDPAPSDLRHASISDGTGQTIAEWADDSVGWFFGEPGAQFDRQEPTDAKWFVVFAMRADDPTTPIVAGMATINGAPAEVSDESDGRLVQMYWGPIDGWMLRGVAGNSSTAEATAIAEQVRIVGHDVVVDDRRVMGDMRPLAAFGDYVSVTTLYQYAYDFGRSLDGLAGVYYGYSGESVVSIPANESALDIMPFLFDSATEEGEVHGRRAVGLTKGAGPFGDTERSTVVWWEGGRLILVAGGDDLAATFQMAERVRPATDGEWAKVTALVDTVDTGLRA